MRMKWETKVSENEKQSTVKSEDRRSKRRHESSSPIRVIVDGERFRINNGELRDISRNGMRIQISREIAVNQRIQIEIEDEFNVVRTSTGKVVWCERTDSGEYQAGCELDLRLAVAQYVLLCDFAKSAGTAAIAG